jgi:hypothetical protein
MTAAGFFLLVWDLMTIGVRETRPAVFHTEVAEHAA